MSNRRNVTLSKHRFGEDLTAEQIQYWQDLGVNASWTAIREVTLLGYLLQGIDLSNEPLRKNVFERRPVPWGKSPSSSNLDQDA